MKHPYRTVMLPLKNTKPPAPQNPVPQTSFISQNGKTIKTIFLLVILGLGINYFIKKGSDFSRLLDISLANFSMATVAILSSFFIFGLKLRQLLSPFNIRLTPREWFGLSVIQVTGNQFFFKAGTIATATYLKTRHQLSFTRFITMMTADAILLFYGLNILGLALSVYMYSVGYFSIYIVLAFCASLLLTGFILGSSAFRLSTNTGHKIFIFLSNLLDTWNHYKKDTANKIKLVALSLLHIFSWAVRYYVAFRILNTPVPLYQCLALSATSFLVGYFNLVPGTLGIREATVGISLAFFGDSFDHGVFATALDRVLAVAWSSLLAMIYFHVLHLKGYKRDLETVQEKLPA